MIVLEVVVLSLCFSYILCRVLLILIIWFLKSISDHFKAHNSPILIPVYKDINIPRFLEFKFSNIYSSNNASSSN